ncbi:MAG TPA: 5'-3' exonuclease H3TH domain-containing protein [Polyangiaceae bacterium]|nr:5'-3' exonuclease H3TH domain-containing protein [Polyangiaceae bacterium]
MFFDTYSMLFRAFHALPPLSTSRGEPTSGLYGFCSLFLRVMREHRPRALAFALDAPARTFRAERDATYKAGRPRTPTPLAEQLERLPALLAAFEAPCFCVPGFEADDVLATLAARLERSGRRGLVVSGDRDLLQLVTAQTSVLFIGARGQAPVLFDEAAVVARFGVTPAELPSYAALVGDSSDNLPGVPGVGPQTAAKLVRAHGSVKALVAALDRITPPKLREALGRHAERALLNEELATLRRDVPLDDGPLAAPLTASSAARLGGLFEALEFKSLVPRLEAVVARSAGQSGAP